MFHDDPVPVTTRGTAIYVLFSWIGLFLGTTDELISPISDLVFVATIFSSRIAALMLAKKAIHDRSGLCAVAAFVMGLLCLYVCGALLWRVFCGYQ